MLLPNKYDISGNVQVLSYAFKQDLSVSVRAISASEKIDVSIIDVARAPHGVRSGVRGTHLIYIILTFFYFLFGISFSLTKACVKKSVNIK